MDQVNVGLIGSGFIAEIHAESFKGIPQARLAAAASPTEGHVREFAARHGIGRWFADYRKMLEMKDLDMVVLCLPNYLHAQACVEAAEAGKHVVCEKPLCMTLAEADRMIEACRRSRVKLMYAEELCFTPKYVRAKRLADEGALGKVYLVKQSEKHFGPHADWFWNADLSGGGVSFDMGCHAVEFFRWILGKREVREVSARMGTYVHADKTQGDDDALIIVAFEGGAVGLAEESWAKPGGMDDRAEIYGSEGVTYANLLQGNALTTFSAEGYGYAVEKAPDTKGWTFTIYEEAWNYGFPQEMRHFTDCILNDRSPAEAGEDGKEVLRALYAAYESARTGRTVAYPYEPPAWATRPIYNWKPWLAPDAPEEVKREAMEWGERVGNL
ncbi:MAG: Gfo/Idh/MocA family oxidoreductase [Armatimonadetes bacterium]|nr:Gfo/Idh/MocA family oxidoreductase [Armatimonadota bacterium]